MKLSAERISPQPLIENSRGTPRTRALRGNELDSTGGDRRVDAPEAGFGGEIDEMEGESIGENSPVLETTRVESGDVFGRCG